MHNPPMILARRFRLVARVALVAVAALTLGCGDATDDRPAKWSFISATITEPSCATVNCHSNIANRAAVDLADRNTGWTDLVNRGFVIPGDTTGSSAVLWLMRGQGSLRMPPDAPLPE